MDIKKIIKKAAAAVLSITAAMILSVSVNAEDYVFDVSSAEATSSWKQTYVHYTALTEDENTSYENNFNPVWMTPESEVLIEYEYTGDKENMQTFPAELIWQTWEVDGKLADGVAGTWNKVAPYEYDGSHAKFSYEDIVKAYGTDNFYSVYCICIGDRLSGVDSGTVKLTSMKITNINRGNLDEEITSRVRIVTTRAEISMGNAYESKSSSPSFTTILIGAGIALAVIIALLIIIIVKMVNKKNSYK
ncbi:MAG: hypothetical protein J6F31_00725 [Oscillospiraceae bacterium]|nr:hypothetical protein [Oscillospiraceae bacterium]